MLSQGICFLPLHPRGLQNGGTSRMCHVELRQPRALLWERGVQFGKWRN